MEVASAAGRTHRLRQPARTLLTAAPVLGIVMLVGGAIVFATWLPGLMSDSSAALPTLLFMTVWLIWGGYLTREYSRVALQVRVAEDEILLVKPFGREQSVRRGDVLEVREQQFLPQPGYTRVKTASGIHYLGPLEDKYELLDTIRSMR